MRTQSGHPYILSMSALHTANIPNADAAWFTLGSGLDKSTLYQKSSKLKMHMYMTPQIQRLSNMLVLQTMMWGIGSPGVYDCLVSRPKILLNPCKLEIIWTRFSICTFNFAPSFSTFLFCLNEQCHQVVFCFGYWYRSVCVCVFLLLFWDWTFLIPTVLDPKT